MKAGSTVDPAAFRDALGSFATGVTVVTTHHNGQDVGLTANSFNSVSLNPPMVLWSLSRRASSLPVFQQSGRFAIHVLTEDQSDLSARFSTRGDEKFAGLAFDRGEGDVPLLSGCSARFECRKAFEYDGGDHTIFVGEVELFEHSPGRPLVFHGGSYATASPGIPARQSHAETIREDLGYCIAAAYFSWRAPALALARELGIGLAERRLLAALLEQDHRSVDDINRSASGLDTTITDEVAHGLVERDFIACAGPAAQSRELALNEAGRDAIVSLIAARRAGEASAALKMGPERTILLQKLLGEYTETMNANDDDLHAQLRRFSTLQGYGGGDT
jgi:3-hydroxy-9,10-secoandrosta-1,3,5(10)-triene-9,17-dione monooxygenase reductase component